MISNFKNGEEKTDVWYELVFDDGHYNGFYFPCDKDGNVSNLNEGMQANYEFCKANPDRFVRFGKVVEQKRRYTEPNTGECECGEVIELYNQYLGACECPKCGRWYNIWGQELNPPHTWSDGDDW